MKSLFPPPPSKKIVKMENFVKMSVLVQRVALLEPRFMNFCPLQLNQDRDITEEEIFVKLFFATVSHEGTAYSRAKERRTGKGVLNIVGKKLNYFCTK